MSTVFTFIHQRRNTRRRIFLMGILLGAIQLASLLTPLPAGARVEAAHPNGFMDDIRSLSALGDRSTGTPGNKAAAEYIHKRFSDLGFKEIGVHQFSVPVLQHQNSTLFLADQNLNIPLFPIRSNAVSPGTIPPQGFSGPLVYVGSGNLADFNGKTLEGAIVLMELDSGKNWQNAANFGAKALIYIDRGPTSKTFFREKMEFSPIPFPRFWLPLQKARELFGQFESAGNGPVAPVVRLNSDILWQEAVAENIYCLVPGSNAENSEDLLLVEAFYDSTPLVAERSPGADEAVGIATLLDLARTLKENPPKRPILLVATGGHAQTLAGMRELIWSIWERSKEIRDRKKYFREIVKNTQKVITGLKAFSPGEPVAADAAEKTLDGAIKDAVIERIKTEVDLISRMLMRLRMQEQDEGKKQTIQALAQQRLVLRRLSWRSDFNNLTPEERLKLEIIVPLAVKDQQAILADAKKQRDQLNSAGDFRSIARTKEIGAVVSLHLSSHGDGFGAFNSGWLYPLKPTINRVSAYSALDSVLRESAVNLEQSLGSPGFFQDTLRPSSRRPWRSYFLDNPPMGGEISALAGYLGVTFATVNDARNYWGTPYDRPDTVNIEFAARQSAMVSGLIGAMAQAPALQAGTLPRNGFATVSGRAKFLRHGELFADQPALESIILAFQGPASYHAMVDHMGRFELKGVADRKHVLDKVILEGYRLEPETGGIMWAIDKEKTGKSAYRVKMQRRAMETDLVMFSCRQSVMFNLLEPRNFHYMTKIRLLDGSREAPPLRYWWSRIDTRSSTIASVFLESGTHYKMTLSDNVIQNKLILTNGSEKHPEGVGYLVDDWPLLKLTEYRIARDMWMLLAPRMANLETHGIFNERIRNLQREGTGALQAAEKALDDKLYDRFAELSSRSWALASRVYDDVEKTQKDVLFGVLFYIALFVPFAFCLERFLFCYSDIYKRIIAFATILILLITVIYKVHPAFQLAYSPMVVILAFFIMGLSLMVTLIIFFRFEDEMILLQRRARHIKAEEISQWKAFVASFFLGVSNLRRRRLRTLLTCATLIILTFTIMSFTSVKTMRHHARLRYQEQPPYQGLLFKSTNWQSLPPETYGIFSNAFEKSGIVLPRVWLEAEDRTQSTPIPIRFNDKIQEAQGLVGLSHQETLLTAADGLLIGGRWFNENERQVILLPDRIANSLGIDPRKPEGYSVLLWGVPYRVVGTFSGSKLMDLADLDGEPLTPVTFPSEAAVEMTEVEMDAVESGDDISAFQSRYQHTSGDLTLIIPFRPLLAAGGHLKALSIRPTANADVQALADEMVDRFGLTLFSGEKDGTFLYNASDAMSYSGVPNIAIPLIISIFIVLNTMIGSVYERKREIGIYTSVGLAPSHVSFLFIAEAMAFAVLSVVLGYLLAQTSAYLFAGTSLWAGITVNYSSLSGVAAMLLVILVVLVSVIYPSRVAAEIAIPDVNRSWTLPQAKDNIIELTLPFLMEYKEHNSIGGYLLDYFKSHQDVSHGVFSTDEIFFDFACPVSPTTAKPDAAGPDGACAMDACLQLHTNVWLAPFDFGIMQKIEVQFCPAEGEAGFLEIKIRLSRKSGEANAWRRINKAFLHALRKQLLIWRSLDEASRDYFESLIMPTKTEAPEK
ncbi:MAG: M28 family peptidase [Desulfobacterales bacterium]|nr:M28 family peptidase [Desulfobacterales bacterium]